MVENSKDNINIEKIEKSIEDCFKKIIVATC